MRKNVLYFGIAVLIILISCRDSETEGLINFGYKVVAKIEQYESDSGKLPDSLQELVPIYISPQDSSDLIEHFKYWRIPLNSTDSISYLQNRIPLKEYFGLELKVYKKSFGYHSWNSRTKNFEGRWF